MYLHRAAQQGLLRRCLAQLEDQPQRLEQQLHAAAARALDVVTLVRHRLGVLVRLYSMAMNIRESLKEFTASIHSEYIRI